VRGRMPALVRCVRRGGLRRACGHDERGHERSRYAYRTATSDEGHAVPLSIRPPTLTRSVPVGVPMTPCSAVITRCLGGIHDISDLR
jgi:hypothetical protein